MSLRDTRTAAERFWAKVNKTPTCWLWTGTGTPKGYGQFALHRSHVYAHRFAYESLVGPIPDGLTIDHLCEVKGCVNPAHLEAVTIRENVRRAMKAKPCEHCGLSVVPPNMSRHIAARHLGSDA